MVKKLFITLSLMLVVLACAAPFILKDRNGKPLLTIDMIKIPDFHLPDLSSIFHKKKEAQPKVETGRLSPFSLAPTSSEDMVVMYTYKDKQGISHFTDQKPLNDNYSIIYLPAEKKNKERTLDSIKDMVKELTQKPKSPKSKPESTGAVKTDESISLLDTYSDPGKIIEQAKEVKRKVEESYRNRNHQIDE